MNDTPRTDRAGSDGMYSTMVIHALRLELELNEMRKDLKNALHWIDDGVDQEGRDLIANPMKAKYFADEN